MRRQLHVKTECNGYRVDAMFRNKMTIFCNNFMEGRRMFDCIAQVCETRGIPYFYPSRGWAPGDDLRDLETLRRYCAGKEVVLLDCTRHFMRQDLVPKIKKDCGMIFLMTGCRKVTPDFLKKNPAACYFIHCTDREIELEKWEPPRTRAAYIAAYGRKFDAKVDKV